MEPIERFQIIEEIAEHLRKEYTYQKIVYLFGHFGIPTDHATATSKKPYAEEVLNNATEAQIFRLASALKVRNSSNAVAKPSPVETGKSMNELDIFISHSSRDAKIAASLIDLLRAALNIPPDKIRCTSVDGFRLQGGANTEEQLRSEVLSARIFVGIITNQALKSAFVLFELGARWGVQMYLLPVLAGSVSPHLLRGPLSGINALDCRTPEQAGQIVEDIAQQLGVNLNRHSVYQKQINALVEVANTAEEIEADAPAKAPEVVEYDEQDCIALIYSYINEKSRSGGNILIHFKEVDSSIGLPEGATAKYIDIAAERAYFSIKNKGANVVTLSPKSIY